MSTKIKSTLLILLFLLIDQVSKVYVKLNFTIGEEIEVFRGFNILFVENNGMAFGLEVIGKLFLTLFRIVAVIVLSVFIHKWIRKKVNTGFILAVSLLLAGALGNIIDSVLYGVIFSESTYGQLATIFPDAGGYAPLMYGKVVDMFYFPLITNAEGEVVFFKYIFNVADACVSVSAVIIFLFYRKELNEVFEVNRDKPTEENSLSNE